ncbi:MAG: DNA repair protein RadA [Chlamydiae bacterium]|nr:DNA repair protein RadA [Chlamydiota bacterium]
MAKTKVIWSCSECGHQQPKWSGSCSVCHKWNTFGEELGIVNTGKRFEIEGKSSSRPLKIPEVDISPFRRFKTEIKEFDRLLGGGIVSGSLTLIGGDPGIGKSTLLLQISNSLACQGLQVLYVCGEESVEQTVLRAQRLGIKTDNIYLLNETLFSSIKAQVEKLKPDILIVDSIQIIYKSEIPSAPGSVAQVRELATEFMHLSKGMGISTFLIGHVTKSGEIAGPRVLEHIVDVVLDFEGDRHHGYRILRGVKNRFGPTDDIALFQMDGQGLTEVENPSVVFLQERIRDNSGSVIIPTIEGSRAFLVEIQALVAPSAFATSSRKSTGIDVNRLALLLAVLEKKVGYQLHNCDVFVSVAGGLKILEPAVDLGIAMAVLSSFGSRSLDPDTVIFGEVGLGGEIRSVPKVENRIKEAIHMGFTRCILPKKQQLTLPPSLSGKIELIGVEKIEEAIDEIIR